MKIENHEEFEKLSKKSIEMEVEGQYSESLEALDLLMSMTKDKMRIKGVLERATYICVIQKSYVKAVSYQNKLVTICEQLYLRKTSLPHPLLAFHYY